ncbi:hypothetical protein BB560_001553 [Smittium megazygosporum]|uniref:Aspartate aminotransferase n=1 Tax=Smittium megazygosporum TaxID=133381 RepID=A0A2T9ZHB1_9FUNG|nr:hypothetical protein BB560_001553 [Smittium megazygosporum]
MSLFANLPEVPPDPILGIASACKADSFEGKVDLSIGAYRDENGKPWILPVVSKAEKILTSNPERNHEYLPMGGLPSFTSAAARIIFGSDSKELKNKQIYSIQGLSGTGSLFVGACFLYECYDRNKTIYISDPTWTNHRSVFGLAGFKVDVYTYWDSSLKTISFEKYISSIRDAPEGSVFILHACAHNPTGSDPTKEQWQIIANEMKAKKHFPFFDSAYQGFATGDLDNDAYAIRLFASMGFEMLVAQSFAKNMGLYGERLGCLHILCKDSNSATRSGKFLEKMSRNIVSSAPRYGAEIASIILNNDELLQEWKQCLVIMSSRILEMRKALVEKLVELKTPGDWTHITRQIGMFSFTGLNTEQSTTMIEKYHVYLTKNGRISVAGLNEKNIGYVASCIDKVVRSAEAQSHL